LTRPMHDARCARNYHLFVSPKESAMEPLSRTLLMSIGIIKNTLTEAELAVFALAPNPAVQERDTPVLDEKTGYELGWDYGRFLGWHPDDEKNKHFLGGFSTAKSKTCPPQQLDRYTRKWLQLRYGAWRRHRSFDEQVTPAFLQEIDRPMCPILGITLTHSTGELTDWSVDRLNNQGGYAVGNLAVMSTQANAAKSNLKLEDIETLAGLSFVSAGLTPLQWKRMVSLLTGPYSVIQVKELLYPLCIVPPPYVPLNLFQEFQLVLVREVHKSKSPLLAKLHQLCATRTATRQFKKLVHRVSEARTENQPAMEIWLKEPIFESLQILYLQLSPETLCRMRLVIERALGSEQVSPDMRQRWALGNKGFF
jgi:hypothetical protein